MQVNTNIFWTKLANPGLTAEVVPKTLNVAKCQAGVRR